MIGRRDFLTGGVAATLSVFANGGGSRADAEGLLRPGSLSVRYWQEDGDPDFNDGFDAVRLTVLGRENRRRGEVLKGIQAVSLEVSYLPFHAVPFRAWSFENGEVGNASSPVSFNVPLDPTVGLNLKMKMVTAYGAWSFPCRFSLGREWGVPKCRVGNYLLTVRTPGAEPFGIRLKAERIEPANEVSA